MKHSKSGSVVNGFTETASMHNGMNSRLLFSKQSYQDSYGDSLDLEVEVSIPC